MSDKQAIDIDVLLQDCWLQVISLRYGPVFQEGEGRILWQRCVADVTRVQQALASSGLDEASCQHILYAQCALIDEVVKGRGVQDDACVEWYNIPLQGHFLGTLDAGDALCNRMRLVLGETTANALVLTCFHRVMMLGFLGGYRGLDDPDREQLVNELSARVAPFRFSSPEPVLAQAGGSSGLGRWLSPWPVRIGLSVLILAALWWGLNHWLDQILSSQLPGVPK